MTNERPPRKIIDAVLDGLVDAVPDSVKPKPGHDWSYDACRFRRDSRCYYPLELNEAASLEAGYAVWVPTDRGYCPD